MRASAMRASFVVLGLALILGMVLTLVLASTSGRSRAHPDLPATEATTTVPPAPTPVEPSKAVELRAKPNVVVVMADDMRVDDLAFAPNLRRLIAEHGVTFENSFSPYPLCCPARASFLTGQYAHNHKVLWHDPPFGYGSFDDSRTIATSLQGAGYRTGFIGKYLNRYGMDPSKVTGEPSYSYVPNGWTDWRGAVENPGGAGFHGQTYDYYDTPFNVNGVLDNRYAGVYQSAVIGDFSVDMARRFAEAGDPFFMYVNYVAPHHGEPGESDDPHGITDANGTPIHVLTPSRPDWVKGRFDDLVDRPSGVARTGEMVESDVTDKPPAVRQRARVLPGAALAALRDATRQRAESIYVMDRHIARLVKELKRSGEWADTVFAFTSDNGMIIGEHGLTMTKVRAYEPSLRVPLLVTGPGLREEQKRYDPVSTVDLAATILDLADARAPYPADGVSRVESLQSGDRGWTTPIVTEALHTSAGGDDPAFGDRRTTIGIRVSQYSYTRYRDGSGELYDLVADPRQDDNVYAAPEYDAVRAALDELWTQVKTCRGKSCAPRLPRRLAADAGQNEANTTAYWDEILRAYGWDD